MPYSLINSGSGLNKAGKVAANAVISGTASELGGGKFANGAITGAFSMMFNDLMHDIQAKRNNLAESALREMKANNVKWATKNNQPLCSKFTQDMMRENGMAPYEHNLLAEAWGDPKSIIPGWDIVTDGTLEAGDVAAYKAKYTNATGHMGIVAYHNDRFQLVYAGTSDKKIYIAATPMTWWKKNYDNIVVRRYVGINK